mgnify:CR=1 FL=1
MISRITKSKISILGLSLIPYSSANNYNPKLNYPVEIKGFDKKKLYKDTYLKQARTLAKQSMGNGPIYALVVTGGFMMLVFAGY